MSGTKDAVDLICSIGELAGLFERSTGLENFLRTAVGIVAYHMRAAVCSVYLYHEKTQELVLTANQGLNPESVGTVRLKLGEGIVGAALKEMRPIREGEAALSPLYKEVPVLHEERYRAFLAVPIVRGLTRVGVLAVQDPVADYFNENDTKALQAIASQLASVIEQAHLLMSLREIQPESPVADQKLEFVTGTAACGGVAYGTAIVLGGKAGDAAWREGLRERPFTVEEFRSALAQTEQQLEQLQRRMEERLADVASMIFSAHLLIVKDENFSGEMLKRMQRGDPPQQAVASVVEQYVELFSQAAHSKLREKVQDVRDLARRLVRNLHGVPDEGVDYRGNVVIADEVLPSDILKLTAQRVEGLLLVSGGVTSHVAILARSLELPMVIVDDRRFLALGAERRVLLDGDQGNVLVDPGAEVVSKFKALAEIRKETDAQVDLVKESTQTRDGRRIRLYANINLLSELQIARKLKAEGVGLYRTEMPFIMRSEFPSEEEQCRIYRKLLRDMDGKPVVFRTLDVGGDKMLSYFPSISEANPFLGLRAIRFSLRFKDIFRQQLRSLLRAGHEAELKIMFPLISSVDDFIEARAVVQECLAELQAGKEPHNPRPALGVMVELPSAVEIAEELAREADFLSIGSNDLVQYILAVDRTNKNVSDLYLSHHPAVLRALNRVVTAAQVAGKPLSLCGEMAADVKMLPFLIGIGIDQLSIEPRHIPQVQRAVAVISYGEACEKARQLLRLGRVRDVADALRGG
jgi:phosphotransferase system enzyme I (PtsP)